MEEIKIAVKGERAVDMADQLIELNHLIRELLEEIKNNREIKNGGKNKSG
tara:strand:+ start:568 stop:717 length:150 start_codon:yes stop_codon:yes gene_type:complete